MDQQIVFRDAVLADRNGFGMSAVHANALVALLAEDHRLAGFEIEYAVGTNSAFGEVVEGVVVEDVAVLVDLDERDALVPRGGLDYRAEMFDVDIDRARYERRLTGYRQ